MEKYRERKQSVYRTYAKSCGGDRRLIFGDQALAARLSPVADALSGVGAILDLGCGTGDLLYSLGTLLGEEASCVGVDLSQDMLAMARQKVDTCPRTSLIQADVTQPLPFADGTFDLIACLNLLHEVAAPMVVLEEVLRVLKPSGSFRGVVACYAGDNPAEMVHQAIARRHTWYFLPADEMLSLFQRVFPTGMGHFELLPRVTHAQAAGLPSCSLFTDLIRKVQDLGHNPEDIRLGALFIETKKG